MMRKAEIDEADQYQLSRQRDFRGAADLIARTFAGFPEVAAVAVTGSVAKPLWREVPRFRKFRRSGTAILHECMDLDLAVWLDRTDHLGEMRRAKDHALIKAYEAGKGPGVATHQADIFLFEPISDRYIGRLCKYSACPKGKPDCLVPGCGAISFNRIFEDFTPDADLLATARTAMLYVRGKGIVMSALDLPVPAL